MNPNPAEFSARELTRLFGEQALVTIGNAWTSRGVSTDTRTLEQGNLFIALRGESTDGHRYLEAALERGAAGALVEVQSGEFYSPLIGRLPLVVVDNTLTALGSLAAYHRRRFSLPVVAVAGSAGKTTTKDMVAAVLATRYTVLKTEGNRNNQIGTPLTLLGLASTHTAAVVEIGTNEPGEIALLSDMTAPTHGLITNIGKEHLEKLIDLDGVEREETTLYAYLFGNRGVALVNTDDERLRRYVRKSHCLTYGLEGTPDVHARVEFDNEHRPVLALSVGGDTVEIRLQATGRTAARNAVAAAAAGHALGVPAALIAEGLESFRPATGSGYGRMVVEQLSGTTLLNDCYNANPMSMHAALETLGGMQCSGKKIAVLGDMRELGAVAGAEHLDLLRHVARQSDLAAVLLLGAEMRAALGHMREDGFTGPMTWYESNEACAGALGELLGTGDIVLVKGSRGLRMEEVVRALRGM